MLVAILDILVPRSSGNDLGRHLNFAQNRHYNFASTAWPLLGPVVFVLYVNRFQIRPEERVLTELFPADYAKYTRRVRRWF